MSNETVLEMRGITKSYFGVTVLSNVDLDLKRGEIHGLVGENGAGKTTLMNILFGMPVVFQTGGFEGTISLGGKPVDIRSPMDAMAMGIGMVHQEFMLLPGFTVTENIKLAREITRPNLVSRLLSKNLETLDLESMGRDARAALDRLGMGLDEWALVGGLPVGHMQFLEIAREIDKVNMRILVFDEPTAVLTESEASQLLDALKRLAQDGIAVLFISHRLDEVLAVADRITVLRDGEVVGRLPGKEARFERIAELMVGRSLERTALPPRATPVRDDDVVLSVRDLAVRMPGERVLSGLSIDVRRGEILGIGGLAGHGKLGIANGIMGLYPATGTVLKDGRPLPLNDPRQALRAGLAFMSEDRRGVGLLLSESIETNVVMTAMQAHNRFLRGRGGIAAVRMRDSRAITRHTLEMIRGLDIRCRGPRQLVRSLSGGNQQKVCLARAFTLQPEVLFVSEPTRGVDVGAKKIVLDLLVEFNRKKGTTVVMTSSELAELRKVCDRIAIVFEGRLAGILPPDASDAEFGAAMAGGRREAV